MIRNDRAKQFMPFASLRGYGEEIRQKEKIKLRKKELTDGQTEELSKTVESLSKGDLIKIVYYSDGGYIEKTGAVSLIDAVSGFISIFKTEIPFSEIYSIEKLEK